MEEAVRPVFAVFVLVLGRFLCARRAELSSRLEKVVGGVKEQP